MDIIAKKIIIHGRVQGVGFRQFTLHLAQKYGIEGTVKNCSNGTVECYARGNSQQMEQFIQNLKRGPILAKVTHLDIENISPTFISSGFRIIY